MSTFETALKFWWGPLSGGGPRRFPHLPHSKSAPEVLGLDVNFDSPPFDLYLLMVKYMQ